VSRLRRLSRKDLGRALDAHEDGQGADLSRHDLRDADLSRRDLSGVSFRGSDMRGADMSASDFTGADLSNALLIDVDLSGSTLIGANLSWSDMTGANTAEATMTGANMTGTVLPGARSHGKGSHFGHDNFTYDFPRIWQYAGTNANGTPWMTSPGVFDMNIMNGFSKFELAVFGNVPWSNVGQPPNQQACAIIKSLNPRTRILMYDPWQWKFTHVSDTQYGDFWSLLNGPPDIRIYRLDGGIFPLNDINQVWWDMGQPGASTAAVNIWKKHCRPLVASGLADGYFCDSVLTVGGPAQPDPAAADYGRAPLSYASLAALEASVAAGTLSFFQQLSAIGGDVFINRGGTGVTNGVSAVITGEMAESWDPDQGLLFGTSPPVSGALYPTFDDAMNKLGPLWRGSSPTGNGTLLVKCETGGALPNSAAWNKLLRYGLSSACILGGLHTMWISDHDPAPINWVADEYSVFPNGLSDTACNHLRWLGRPLAYGFKDAGGCWVRYFKNGVCAVNGHPTLSQSIDLGKQYRRITGPQWPTINNGTVEQNATLAPKDGRFWVNYP